MKHFNPFPPLHKSCCSWKYSFNHKALYLSNVLYFLPIAVEPKPLLGGRAFYLLCLIVTPFSLMTQKKFCQSKGDKGWGGWRKTFYQNNNDNKRRKYFVTLSLALLQLLTLFFLATTRNLNVPINRQKSTKFLPHKSILDYGFRDKVMCENHKRFSSIVFSLFLHNPLCNPVTRYGS